MHTVFGLLLWKATNTFIFIKPSLFTYRSEYFEGPELQLLFLLIE